MLRYPYQNNRIIRELLCLVYHGSLLLTTTFFAFRVHLLWMNCHFLHFILQRRSHYGQLSEFLPGNDFPTRPYTPHSDILLHLYFCLSGLSFRLPMQRPSRCLLAGTPRFYPLATESPFPFGQDHERCHLTAPFFTIYVLHKTWDDSQLPRRRFDEYLPYVPSQKDTWTFISTIPDLKVKAFVTLLYSAGLRSCEVRNLKCPDIEHSNKRIFIRQAKNRSSRYAILSDTAWDTILEYWYSFPTEARPRDWLFTQQRDKTRPLNHEHIPHHIALHEKRLGWEHRISCHTFRHAFGTHLYENGTDLLTIKALLGHKSITSTTIYVHLASNGTTCAVSPLDRLAGEYRGRV